MVLEEGVFFQVEVTGSHLLVLPRPINNQNVSERLRQIFPKAEGWVHFAISVGRQEASPEEARRRARAVGGELREKEREWPE